MPKDLLKIIQIKDAVCQIEYNCSNKKECEIICACITSIMAQDKHFSELLMQNIATYMLHKNEFEEVLKESNRRGKIKTLN